MARAWFQAMDRSMGGKPRTTEPPHWISHRYRWGPSLWPQAWCAVVDSHVLDCGALAALATEAFRLRRREISTLQLIERVTFEEADHWRRRWMAAGCATDWIAGEFVYHEACVVVGKTTRVWDPSQGSWRRPLGGAESTVVAARLCPEEGILSTESVEWDSVRLRAGLWVKLPLGGQNRRSKGATFRA